MNYLNTQSPIRLFQEVLNDEIYVDKSLLIEKLSKFICTSTKYICITRPRRFGKSINANMLGAYYTTGFDTHQMFENLAVAKKESYRKHLNKHNVIYIDFSRMPDRCQDYETYFNAIQSNLIEDIQEAYPKLNGKRTDSISKLLRDTSDSFIFIMDEWDSIFYRDFMTKKDKDDYLLFLKGLLKDQPYVDLAYMTGVLPIAKYSSGSELNMFREHNFMNDYTFEEYFGLNEDEVKELCKQYSNVTYKELCKWYDGYYMTDGRHLFNPRSVKYALMDGVCLNYWTETGPMNEVADCIEHNVDAVRDDIVKLVAGIPVEVRLKGYSAAEQQLTTRDEILSAMVVYGFLAYHDGVLRIPNYELMEKFQDVLERESFGEIKAIADCSKEVLEATLAMDEQRVSKLLEQVHDREIPFLKYNDENSLSCVVTLCYLYARNYYDIKREEKSGKGYCDYLFVPKRKGKPAIILELKAGHSSEQAIAQIKQKNYMQQVEHCDEILLVGISYDGEKQHSCKIEKWEKDL